MNLANKLTFFRLFLAPVFFIIYLLPNFFPSLFAQAGWTIPVLWLIFITCEITDLLDGLAARKLGETSDFGRLFDPFADTLMQITCFLCFVMDGIFHVLPLLLVIYREFGILFIRNLMLKKGATMGARLGGKIKTVCYIIAAGAALLAASLRRLDVFKSFFIPVLLGANILFLISVVVSIVSFIDYFLIYRKTEQKAQ